METAIENLRTEEGVARLRALVRRRLGAILGPRYGIGDADLEDFTQDACVRILDSLGSFRGDAKFATWATTIAVRVAMTELRRRRWTAERVHDALDLAGDGPPCDAAERVELHAILRRAIRERLTRRQRVVVLGELRGIPQVRIAEHLGATPNSVYKVSHDARKKLRSALEEAGYDALSVRKLLAGASKRTG